MSAASGTSRSELRPHERTREELRERVVEVVHDVPEGAVTTYGDIAAVVGTGARQVGRIMSEGDAAWPWWRVTNAAGRLPEHLQAEALAAYREEGTPIRGDHADLWRARWRPGFDE